MKKKIEEQKIEKAKGRALLDWVGKKPLEKIEYYPAQEKEAYGDLNAKEFNKIFFGDNLQVLSHLLKKYRGKINLIYIDPPFDSKADYVKKIKVKGEKIEGEKQSLIEEKQYTDIWRNDEYFQFMYERLLILKELLSDEGAIALHCDYHKAHYLKIIMDEIFGDDNFRNEIIVKRVQKNFAEKEFVKKMNNAYDNVFLYSKTDNFKLIPPRKNKDYDYSELENWHSFDAPNWSGGRENLDYELFGQRPPSGNVWRWTKEKAEKAIEKGLLRKHIKTGKPEYLVDNSKGQMVNNLWTDILAYSYKYDYPTEKGEKFLSRIIKCFSSEGDIVLDCFMGSGTTPAVAQKLNRRWIGCDINKGSIQTTIKRLSNVIREQTGQEETDQTKQLKLAETSEKTADKTRQIKQLKNSEKLSKNTTKSFKVYSVNNYEGFKNELEAKGILIDIYGVQKNKGSYFDGVLDNNFVKILPISRVLNKLDVEDLLENIEKYINDFTVKKSSIKATETIYKEKVLIICSGFEPDALDFMKRKNKTDVNIEIRDILKDKANLIFKKPCEAEIEFKKLKDKIKIEIKDFYSPILMRKLEIENSKSILDENKARVEDFKQIIESVAIDTDYNEKIFNAEIIDIPSKKELIKGVYEAEEFDKVVAVKIIDVLGEEYFETFEV